MTIKYKYNNFGGSMGKSKKMLVLILILVLTVCIVLVSYNNRDREIIAEKVKVKWAYGLHNLATYYWLDDLKLDDLGYEVFEYEMSQSELEEFNGLLKSNVFKNYGNDDWEHFVYDEYELVINDNISLTMGGSDGDGVHWCGFSVGDNFFYTTVSKEILEYIELLCNQKSGIKNFSNIDCDKISLKRREYDDKPKSITDRETISKLLNEMSYIDSTLDSSVEVEKEIEYELELGNIKLIGYERSDVTCVINNETNKKHYIIFVEGGGMAISIAFGHVATYNPPIKIGI